MVSDTERYLQFLIKIFKVGDVIFVVCFNHCCIEDSNKRANMASKTYDFLSFHVTSPFCCFISVVQRLDYSEQPAPGIWHVTIKSAYIENDFFNLIQPFKKSLYSSPWIKRNPAKSLIKSC